MKHSRTSQHTAIYNLWLKLHKTNHSPPISELFIFTIYSTSPNRNSSIRHPLKLKNNGGHTSSTDLNSCSFQRYAILSLILWGVSGLHVGLLCFLLLTKGCSDLKLVCSVCFCSFQHISSFLASGLLGNYWIVCIPNNPFTLISNHKL